MPEFLQQEDILAPPILLPLRSANLFIRKYFELYGKFFLISFIVCQGNNVSLNFKFEHISANTMQTIKKLKMNQELFLFDRILQPDVG
jgi:hypothetical protein